MSELEVPIELIAQAIQEQRDLALAEAAQMKAAVRYLQAENDQLRADLEKLRADATSGAESPSSANGATTTRTATPART